MKTLYLSIIVFSVSLLLVGTSHSVFAPCLVGVTDCGPPPGITVSASTNSQFYEKNDTIHVQGQVYVPNYILPIEVKVVNPNGITIQTIDAPIFDGKFELDIGANFNTTGLYQISTCLQDSCSRSYFKFISEPYKLTVNGQDFFIKYKSYADLVNMEADIDNKTLRVHITNAAAQGLQFVIEVPRALVDSKDYDDNDVSLGVLIGMHQPDKYMQFVNYTEISHNALSRTLAIDIPYEPVPNSSGTWDLKIMSVGTILQSVTSAWSPLKQVKSGISTNDIACKDGFYLAIRSDNQGPVCLKAGTISKLAPRGFFYNIATNKNDVNYTTVLIPPGSENQASHNTYSPNVVTVVIGINNTIRWVSQSQTANTIVSDRPLIQNGESFESDGVIKPGQSYEFTFTEPGTFTYHTDPHPWMKGTVIVKLPAGDNTRISLQNNPVLSGGCDNAYVQNAGIPVLFMPTSSVGKICVRYSNPNQPFAAGFDILEAQNYDKQAENTKVSSDPDSVPHGNSTVVYTIYSGDKAGFYRMLLSCPGMQLAMGYDGNSNFVPGDFPWLAQTFYCPLQSGDFHIVGLSGIGIKYMSYP
ncbi:MAG: cupredoxin domain-containing protein [Nitrosotalea sp.]